jgi:hypothetical protein
MLDDGALVAKAVDGEGRPLGEATVLDMDFVEAMAYGAERVALVGRCGATQCLVELDHDLRVRRRHVLPDDAFHMRVVRPRGVDGWIVVGSTRDRASVLRVGDDGAFEHRSWAAAGVPLEAIAVGDRAVLLEDHPDDGRLSIRVLEPDLTEEVTTLPPPTRPLPSFALTSVGDRAAVVLHGPRWVRQVRFDPRRAEVIDSRWMNVQPGTAGQIAAASDDVQGTVGVCAANLGFFLMTSEGEALNAPLVLGPEPRPCLLASPSAGTYSVVWWEWGRRSHGAWVTTLRRGH